MDVNPGRILRTERLAERGGGGGWKMEATQGNSNQDRADGCIFILAGQPCLSVLEVTRGNRSWDGTRQR